MMLFGSGPKKTGVPVVEVKQMSEQGMTDKQIIDELKKKGYSMDDIEKAMLQMVKESPEPSLDLPKFDDSPLDLPGKQPDIPDPLADSDHLSDVADIGSDEIENPEDIVEELVEGIIEDKMKSVSKDMDSLKEKFASIKSDIDEIKKTWHTNIDVSEISMKVNEMETKIMDLGVRIGALEKAFKQLLPSLVDNIHNLSRIVNELKQSHLELKNEVWQKRDFRPEPARESPPQPPASQTTEARATQFSGTAPASEASPAKREQKSSGLTEDDIKKILGQM